jgi:hypothetical protein
MGTPRKKNTQPSPGDVLITSEHGNYLVSVIPHPHRLSFTELSQALEIAAQWASVNGTHVWRVTDGEPRMLRLDGSNAAPMSIRRPGAT